MAVILPEMGMHCQPFAVESGLCLDLSNEEYCRQACEDAVEVYNVAADMGGMGLAGSS